MAKTDCLCQPQDLYHELLALDTVTASLRRAQAEEEQFPGTQKGDRFEPLFPLAGCRYFLVV